MLPLLFLALIARLLNLVTRVLKKVLRCNCPAQKGQRSRKFVRLLTHFLKTVKIYTGWNCRKQRIFLRVVASSLDSFVDYLKELKNPFYFYSMDDELKERLHNILQACRIHRPLPYVLMLPPWKVVKINKIAEGSYGEIYLVKNTDGSERILKIIGVYGSPRDDPSRSLDFEDAVGDVICTKSLSKLAEPGVFQAPNFPKAFSIDLVKGKAPKCLVDAWQRFQDDPNTEETYHFKPDRYTPDSLFLVMELENCGEIFLSTPALNIMQALSLVLQTASALAVAECAYGFEHRDLHLGNWLIRRTDKNWLYYSTRHWRWSLPTFGVQAFLIDFTMSRIQVDGNVFAMDLSYLSESEQQGDANLLNHNNIYGMMKDALREDFTAFKPLTNLWWLAHLTCNVYSMQRELSLVNPEMDEFSRVALYALERLKDNILHYPSTMEFLRAEVFNVNANNNLIGEGWSGPQLLLQPL